MSCLKILSIGLFVLMAGCGQFDLANKSGFTDLASAEKVSCYYNVSSTGALISWAPLQSITFYLHKNIPQEFYSTIQDAAKMWALSNGAPLIQVAPQPVDSSGPQADSKNIIYWIDGAGVLQTYEQGRTLTRWKKSKIYDADILIHAAQFQFFSNVPSSQKEIHLKSLLVHEFGHALGIRHIPQPGSVMYSSLMYSEIRYQLKELDEKSLRCQYP